jgi:hypothetical protein
MAVRYNAPKTRTVIDTGTLGRPARPCTAPDPKIPSESLSAFMLKYLQRLARPERFELPTPRFVVCGQNGHPQTFMDDVIQKNRANR